MNNLKNNIIDIAHNYYKYLMNLENVVGVGRGNKSINGINILEPCIHVLVKNKVCKKYLTKNNIIPNRYMGIKTDVLEVGDFKPSKSDEGFSDKVRPLKSGCVIGLQAKKFSGTLGCIVTKNVLVEDSYSDSEDDSEPNFVKEYYILSNNHVIANTNEAAIGSLIIQPSKVYNGVFPRDLVGVLDTFVKIELEKDNEERVNYVDCAIARITNKNYISSEILSLGKIKGVSKAELDMEVKKSGFASGITTGVITTLNLTITVEFLNKKSALFKEQIMGTLKISSGDSGSGLFTNDNKIVGLIMASSNSNKYSVCNDINTVFKKLKVELYTG